MNDWKCNLLFIRCLSSEELSRQFLTDQGILPRWGKVRSSPRNTSFLTGEQLLPHRGALERTKKELSDAFFAYPAQRKEALISVIMKEIAEKRRTIALLFHSQRDKHTIMHQITSKMNTPNHLTIEKAAPTLRHATTSVFLPQFIYILSIWQSIITGFTSFHPSLLLPFGQISSRFMP